MKKYHLGCAGGALHELQTIDETLDDLRDAGYQSVDLWLYLFHAKPDDPMNRADWRDWVRELDGKLRARGLYVEQAHSLLDQYIPEDFSFREPPEIAARDLEASAMLGCTKTVFHPLYYVHPVRDEATRQKILDYNIRWFSLLRPVAEKFGVYIQLENALDFFHFQQPGDPVLPFTCAEDILALLDALGPRFEACLDTGHANLCGYSSADFARKLGSRLKTLHLNDNVGRFDTNLPEVHEDMHQFPGYGTVDWDAFFRALYEIGFDGVINLEPAFYVYRGLRKAWQNQFRAGADITRAMAEKAGFQFA